MNDSHFMNPHGLHDDNHYTTDQVIKYNPVLDLAVIRIDRPLNPLRIYNGPQKLVRGQKVVAIGSPLGLFNSVSDGIISGFRKIDDVDMIQFTAPISHGSSGGAVLNMYGEVIGINTAKLVDSTAEGIGYAIPISSVLDLINDMMNWETMEKVPEDKAAYMFYLHPHWHYLELQVSNPQHTLHHL